MELQNIAPGTYIVAVSGGVDSMVLLDLLRQQAGLALIVAHYDHGIRPDSAEDATLVGSVAASHGLMFVSEQGSLGTQASEATARNARYAFLRRVMTQHQAQAIITAHHQDDMLETAILNILRGTGRKGLASLQSQQILIRPLLAVSKRDIRQYATHHALAWREDSTNSDEQYARNYVRRRIIPRISPQHIRQFLRHIDQAAATNPIIDTLIATDLACHVGAEGLDRRWFMSLPHEVAREVMAAWLRSHAIQGFDRQLLARLVVAANTAQAGKRFDVLAGYFLEVESTFLQLRERASSKERISV